MKLHRRVIALGAAAVVALLAVPTAGAVAATTPYCGITWGSTAKSSPGMAGSPIVGARVGRQDCYDRLVIDIGGMPASGYSVRYADGLYNQDSGQRVPVAGGALLMVTARASVYDAYGRPTVGWRWADHIVGPEALTAGGFRTFRDLVYGGSFEGQTDFALGVRARLPFRVFTLAGPGGNSRLIVDVAHQW